MRRSGKTTRLIDTAIQLLFLKGEIKVPFVIPDKNPGFEVVEIDNIPYLFDPDCSVNFLGVQRDFALRLVRRINLEHSHQVIIDKQSEFLRISLKNV